MRYVRLIYLLPTYARPLRSWRALFVHNLCQILDYDDNKILVFPLASSLRASFVNLKKLASTTGVSDAARKEVHWKLEAAVPLPCV